jgi:hypothetical protein
VVADLNALGVLAAGPLDADPISSSLDEVRREWRPSLGAQAIERAVAELDPATEALLQNRQLLRRHDSKFSVPLAHVANALEESRGAYAVLHAGGRSVATYETLYFDTAELRAYHDHRRGRRLRSKVRIRRYPERGLAYLEVKNKDRGDMTSKRRWRRPYDDLALTAEERDELARAAPSLGDSLVPTVHTWFRRLTLLGREHDERITIDLDLLLFNASELVERTASFERLAVIEAKQPRISRQTPFVRALRRQHARAMSFSKYCAAVALCVPGVKAASFRVQLRTAEKIEHADAHRE